MFLWIFVFFCGVWLGTSYVYFFDAFCYQVHSGRVVSIIVVLPLFLVVLQWWWSMPNVWCPSCMIVCVLSQFWHVCMFAKIWIYDVHVHVAFLVLSSKYVLAIARALSHVLCPHPYPWSLTLELIYTHTTRPAITPNIRLKIWFLT